MLKDFIIKYDFQPLTSDDTTSHKTRAKVIHIKDNVLQQSWLSYWYRGRYVLSNVGGRGSFVYMIGAGVNENNWVSNFFHFVGFFKPKV
jgi:hypothetical protein